MQYNMVKLPSKRSHIQKCLTFKNVWNVLWGWGATIIGILSQNFTYFGGKSPKEKRSEKKDQNKEKKLHKA